MRRIKPLTDHEKYVEQYIVPLKLNQLSNKQLDTVIKLVEAQMGRIQKQTFGGAPDNWIDLSFIKDKLEAMKL